MADINKIITIATNEVGYLEKNKSANLDSKIAGAGDGNYTKYWRDLQPSYQGQPWCQGFVNWCFVQAYGVTEAKKLLCTQGSWSYYTPTAAGYFKNKKQWYPTPMKGDVIYFKNSTRIYHVGLVYQVDSSYVYTIEGNTNAGNEVVANGGGVAKKKYSLNNSKIAGYGRPNYGTQTSSTTVKTEIEKIESYNKGLKVMSKLNIRDNPGMTNTNIVGVYSQGSYIKPTERTRTIEGIYWFKTDKGFVSGKFIQGWVKDSNGSWWYNDCGKYPSSDWKTIDGKQYYFMKDGYMAKSCYAKFKNSNEWGWLDEHGALDTSKTTKLKPNNNVVV